MRVFLDFWVNEVTVDWPLRAFRPTAMNELGPVELLVMGFGYETWDDVHMFEFGYAILSPQQNFTSIVHIVVRKSVLSIFSVLYV